MTDKPQNPLLRAAAILAVCWLLAIGFAVLAFWAPHSVVVRGGLEIVSESLLAICLGIMSMLCVFGGPFLAVFQAVAEIER